MVSRNSKIRLYLKLVDMLLYICCRNMECRGKVCIVSMCEGKMLRKIFGPKGELK
jgi:hypothetical protein